MKLLFKNRTKYSKKVYNEYLNFHRNKYNLSYKFYTIIVALLLFFCIGMQVKYHYYSLAILLCVIFTFFILWRLFRPVYEVKKEYQSKKIADEQTFIFKFYENFFVITNKLQYSKVRYFKLYKIFETTDFFYLYIDKEHAFLIDKNGFTFGSAEEFSKFIHKKCLFKYKNEISQ